jgi:hypothetical protein
MKQTGAEAGGRRSFPSWASRFASASALAPLLLLVGSGAKADVIETFKLAGNFTIPSTVAFTGTINLDYTDDFTQETVTSITISVGGKPVFQSHSLTFALSGDPAVVSASNSRGDTLSLMFTTPEPYTFAGFNKGTIVGGQAIFLSDLEFLFSPTGVVTRDPSHPAILDPPDPPIIDPPDPPSVPVPELSTWTMMLVGLAGLGLAAKGRRVLAFLGRRP